jgi:hypothetical protein
MGATSSASLRIEASVKSPATLSALERTSLTTVSPGSLDRFCVPGNTPLNAYDLILEEDSSPAAPAAPRKLIARMGRPAGAERGGPIASAAAARNVTCTTGIEWRDALPHRNPATMGTLRPRAVSLLIVAE